MSARASCQAFCSGLVQVCAGRRRQPRDVPQHTQRALVVMAESLTCQREMSCRSGASPASPLLGTGMSSQSLGWERCCSVQAGLPCSHEQEQMLGSLASVLGVGLFAMPAGEQGLNPQVQRSDEGGQVSSGQDSWRCMQRGRRDTLDRNGISEQWSRFDSAEGGRHVEFPIRRTDRRMGITTMRRILARRMIAACMLVRSQKSTTIPRWQTSRI
eukprot:366496-Hanusia_phi.AAC.2